MWKAYFSPTSIEEALRLLADYGPEARIVAGGTDLLVEYRHGTRPAPVLVDVTRIQDLDRSYLDERNWIRIGPTATHNQVVRSKTVTGRGLPLAQACYQVGTPPLRNRATVAGNLVTASPANDTITALWALDAQLTLRNIRGERTLSFPDFYHGVRQTALAPDEMVTDIAFPALSVDQRGVFVKLGLRRTHAIALVTAAVVLTFDGDTVTRARITLGSVAPTIIRAPEAEVALVGRSLDDALIAKAAGLAARAATPIDDVRGGAAYRSEMSEVLVRQALVALRGGPDALTQSAVLQSQIPEVPPMLWGKTDGRFPPLEGETVSHGAGAASPIEFTVNARRVAVLDAADKTLLEMLRDDLGLTGSKEGCGEGECGACTVWMDGIAVFACLVPAPRAHGTQVVTVEGLASGETLHPVQDAFINAGAVQCGYCTPGFIMSGANLLDEIPHPSREQIVAGLNGNLCRCTGYYKIVQAMELAVERA
jgi:carbon-monoxide dehydrogenase medium subunit